MKTFGPDLEIGVPEIDAQHREIFGALRTFDGAIAALDEDAVDLALRILSRYVLEHFETEERWMRRTTYPRIREHVAKHDEFVTRLVGITNDHAAAGATAVLGLRLRNALTWLREHIEGEDQLLARHVAPAASVQAAARAAAAVAR